MAGTAVGAVRHGRGGESRGDNDLGEHDLKSGSNSDISQSESRYFQFQPHQESSILAYLVRWYGRLGLGILDMII